jgi:hypothetical protein
MTSSAISVGAQPDACRSITELWKDDGWSVSTFRREDFGRIASNGSLFVQHLKGEGIIIRDDDGFLVNTFNSYVPRNSYWRDCKESIATIFLLDISKTKCYWELLCAADIAYVSTRNAAIMSLAEKRIFEFDFKTIVRRLASERNIGEELIDSILELRWFKHCYRNRVAGIDIGSKVEKALTGARALFGPLAGPFPRLGDYNTLRFIELTLVRATDPRDLDSLPSGHPLQQIWSVIIAPRPYPRITAINAKWLNNSMAVAEQHLGIKLKCSLY